MLASLLMQAFFAGRRKYLMPGGEVVFGEEEARAFLERIEETPVNRIGNIPAKKKTKKKVRKVKRISEVRLRHALDEAEDRARQRDDDDLIAIILAME